MLLREKKNLREKYTILSKEWVLGHPAESSFDFSAYDRKMEKSGCSFRHNSVNTTI